MYFWDDKNSKSIGDTLVARCDEIIFVMDIVSTKMRSTKAPNLSLNSDGKKM